MFETKKEVESGKNVGDTMPKKAIKEEAKKRIENIKHSPSYEIFELCFKKLGTFFYPLSHESIGQAYGYFQNYLLSQITGNLVYKIPKVEIKTANDKEVSDYIKDIKDMKENEEKILSELFSEDRYKYIFRSNPNFFFLHDARETAEQDHPTEPPEDEKLRTELIDEFKEPKSKFLSYLKEVACSAHDRCMKYKDDKGVENFAEHWMQFMTAALELEEHFKPIEEVINKVTEGKVLGEHMPKFTIYRILVGTFIETYYEPIASQINENFFKLLKELNEFTVRYYTIMLTRKKYNEEQNFDELDKFEKEIEDKFLEPIKDKRINHKTLCESIKEVSDYLISILDMYVNEMNVHYIQNSNFPDYLDTESDSNLLTVISSVAETFYDACKMIEDYTYMEKCREELIFELMYQYRIIFPTCFLILTSPLGKRKNILYMMEKSMLNDKVKEKIFTANEIGVDEMSEYRKLLEARYKRYEENEKKEKNVKSLEEDDSEVFQYTVKMVEKNGGQEKKKNERIAEYLFKEDLGLIKAIFFYKRKKLIHSFTDTAILARNKELRGEMNNDINKLYSMKGT